MTTLSDDTATIEYAETLDTERLLAAQAFRREQYRQACLNDPEAVKAYEREIERRRAATAANAEARAERQR